MISDNMKRINQSIVIQPSTDEIRFTKLQQENKQIKKELNETKELAAKLIEKIEKHFNVEDL